LTIKEGRFLVAISLRTEDRSVARSRAMLIDEEAARLVQTACSHATFGDALRSFVLTLESDHRLRLLNDLESRSVRTSDNVETVLADRARQNVLYAALYWIAHRCGPGVPAQWDVLEPYLVGWALHEPEDLPLRDKIVEKVAKGFIAECFVAGSGISGTPTAEAISEALAQAGQDDTNHNRRVLFGELALTQTVSLLNAAKRYRLSPAELDTWRYSHRRQPTPSQRETGSLWPAPAFADADAVGRGDFDINLDPSNLEVVGITARIAADYLPYTPAKSPILTGQPKDVTTSDAGFAVTTMPTMIQRLHEQEAQQLSMLNPPTEPPAPSFTVGEAGFSETARMFLEEHPTIDDLVALAISRRGKKWSDHTRKQVKGIGRLLAKVAGSNEVASIKPFHISRYRDVLDQLSKKYGKSPADAYRSLDELISIGAKADKDERGLSAGTINRHLTQLGALVAVLASFDIDLAPAKGMNTLRIEDEDAEDLKRDQFTDDQVRAIFSGAPWNGVAVAPEDEGFYWLTILAAYTGARPNELVWLQRQDVDIDQKVIFIRPNSSRRLKTKESKRDIIVHKHLLALGFIDFVNRQSNPLDHIFTGYISHRRKNARERFTNQFNNLLETSIPGRSGGKLTLYSFRHKFMNQLLRNGVDTAIKDMITGHARTGTRDRVYSKSIDNEQQRQILDAIDFSAGSQIQRFVAVPQKARRIRHTIRKISVAEKT
jgi:integrase